MSTILTATTVEIDCDKCGETHSIPLSLTFDEAAAFVRRDHDNAA